MRANKSSHKALIMTFLELALGGDSVSLTGENDRNRALLELEREAQTMIALSQGVPFYNITDILLKEAYKIRKRR